METPRYYPRTIEQQITRWMRAKEGILIAGARQTGKSTLLRHLAAAFPKSRFVSFDDRGTYEQFVSNAQGLLEQLVRQYHPIFIDEFQKVPAITHAVKYLYDRLEPTPKFFLSGSVSDALTAGGDSMVGRVVRLSLYSLSFPEYLRARAIPVPSRNVDHPDAFLESSSLLSAELSRYLLFGGYPATVTYEEHQFPIFFQSLETAFLEKDLLGKLREGKLEVLRNLMRILAKRVGFPLSLNHLSNELGVDIKTVKRHVELLRFSYWIDVVRPKALYGSELKNKFKAYFSDTGVRNSLAADASIDSGPMLENFVYGVLKRKLAYAGVARDISFWHTYDGGEVDFVVGDCAIEVKNQRMNRTQLPRSLCRYIEKHRPRAALVVNKNFWGETRAGTTRVRFLPAYALPFLSLKDV